jgi:cyclic pyranopterin phosphate synthase
MTTRLIDRTVDHYKMFNLISMETWSQCNRRCDFCPVATGTRPKEEMPWSTIMAILQELEELRYKGRIEPFIYNEPLLDPRLMEILRKTRELLPDACIAMNTNGDLLQGPDHLARLFDAGLNQLAINVYGKDEVAGTKRFTTFVKWLDDIHCDQDSSVWDRALPTERRAKVFPKFCVEPDGTNFGGGFELQNRSGQVPWLSHRTPAEPLQRVCTRPFRILQINWKGQGIVCCNDYEGITEFGSVLDHGVWGLWNHPVLDMYRRKLQFEDRRMPLCDKCDFRGGPYPHMIVGVDLGAETNASIDGVDLRRPVTGVTVNGEKL